MSKHRWALCLCIGLVGLASLAAAYWFTYEPAPGVRVTWGADVSPARQEALERRYMLSNRRAPHPEQPRSLAYDLLDTSHSNIEALLKDPGIVDTNDIDDQWATVRFGTAYGEQWMWVAHRTPLLRYTGIRWTLIAALTAMVLAGLRGLAKPQQPAQDIE